MFHNCTVELTTDAINYINKIAKENNVVPTKALNQIILKAAYKNDSTT